MSKDARYIELLNCRQWRALRAFILGRHPLCAICEKNGRLSVATEVHHAVPIETAPTYAEMRRLAYDPANLVPVCHECHAAEHKALQSKSKATLKKRDAAWLETIKKRYPT